MDSSEAGDPVLERKMENLHAAHIANRIVRIIPPSSGEVSGGIEAFLASFIRDQLASGMTCSLYCAEGSQLPGANLIPLAPATRNIDFEDYLGMSIQQAFRAVQDIAGLREVDVVLDHTGFTSVFAGVLDVPVGVWLHNGLEQAKIFSRRCVENVSFIATSQSDKRVLEAAGIMVDHQVYYDFDASFLHARSLELNAPTEKKLVWMGRMHPQKGPDLAIQVALQAGYKLYMGGSKPQAEHMDWFNQTIRPFVDGDRINFLGFVNNQQKPEFLTGAKAFLMPNRCYENSYCAPWYEPFGVVMLEAEACRVPVLGTEGGSLPEIIQDAGICVPSSSDEETVAKMVAALSDPASLTRGLSATR